MYDILSYELGHNPKAQSNFAKTYSRSNDMQQGFHQSVKDFLPPSSDPSLLTLVCLRPRHRESHDLHHLATALLCVPASLLLLKKDTSSRLRALCVVATAEVGQPSI